MRNPLNLRIKRDLFHDIGKYVALFLFLATTISFVSGFLIADDSLKKTYEESFEKYNIEDGHFTLAAKADNKLIKKLEKDEAIRIYPLFSVNLTAQNNDSLRIYKNRTEINRVDLLKGKLPETDNEISLDRLYAENNNIKIGDIYRAGGKDYTLCGLFAGSDYSALFKNNSDMMFDANKFSIALVSDKEFQRLSEKEITYTYAWLNKETLSREGSRYKADDIKKTLSQKAPLTNFVPRENNQAINFAGNDMGQDKAMMTWLLYIIIVILAFVFGVTTKSTIKQEAGIIGTLRASGYKKREMLRYYITLPTLIMLLAAAIGNIIGYTVMKHVCAELYYNSYSLTTYKTLWNGEAFIKTTLVPCAIILIVNLLMIIKSLSLPPLAFLRHDLRKNETKRVTRLPNFKFIRRFRLRIIEQNKSIYITMFIGVFFASVLLIFGMMLHPLLSNFRDSVSNSQIANYQYVLKEPISTKDESAEKYAISHLKDKKEEITVFGIENHSKYFPKLNLPKAENEVVVSMGYAEKFGLNEGDKITLSEKYKTDKYTFRISGIYDYPSTLSVFMNLTNYNRIFNNEERAFTGYFSDKKLTDIDENYVATIITQKDLTVVADQMEDSMGGIMPSFCGFTVLLFGVMIYLLGKIIIEHNSQSISMLKILGYTTKEISKLYNYSTAVVVGGSLLISLPLAYLTVRFIYYIMMQEFKGWLPFWIAPWIYPAIFAIGIGCYFMVNLIEMKKLRRIPMTQALKNIE